MRHLIRAYGKYGIIHYNGWLIGRATRGIWMITPERLDALQAGWVRLLTGFGVAAVDAYPVFDRLVAAYSEPHRYYHTLEHIAEMLKVVGRLAPLSDQLSAIQLAVWFHDAVYDTSAKDNEERSAQWATHCLGELAMPDSVIQMVAKLIRATNHRSHNAACSDENMAILLDADLAILAAAEPRYLRYATDIRREYADLSDQQYRSGRIAVLQTVLDRPRIYSTHVMFIEGEASARRNLQAEIERLQYGS
jgi:predicted metal-dependent HD superfamily phosphohydrolase